MVAEVLVVELSEVAAWFVGVFLVEWSAVASLGELPVFAEGFVGAFQAAPLSVVAVEFVVAVELVVATFVVVQVAVAFLGVAALIVVAVLAVAASTAAIFLGVVA